MANVLVVTCIYPDPSAAHVGTFVANWSEQLRATGLDVMVYKRDHITFGSYLNFSRIHKFYTTPRVCNYHWHGIPVCRQGIHLRLPLDYSKSSPRLTYRKIKPVIADIYKKFPFDIVYLATWGDLSLAMAWIAKEMEIPYIASAIGDHTTLHFEKPGSLYYRLERETYLGSEFVVCVSQDMENKVKNMTDGKAKTIAFYSGVDTERFKPSPEIRHDFRQRLGYVDEDTVFLFTGRITKEKGVYELLDSFTQVAKDRPDLKLLLVGPLFEETRFRKTIRRLGIEEKVAAIGGVGHDEIPFYMNAADIFVFPSWMEGLPNVVMEACACQLPVVASEVGGIPELIENDITGFMVPPRSPEILAEKLALVINDPENAAVMAGKARQKMEREFNYHQNGQILSDQLQGVIEFSKKNGISPHQGVNHSGSEI